MRIGHRISVSKQRCLSDGLVCLAHGVAHGWVPYRSFSFYRVDTSCHLLPLCIGKPKAITGFVTNTTPVLLGHGERAQLGTEEYLPLTPILEGFVIVKKNPEFEQAP